MERSVLEMLSDRSSALTLLGCRPSARKSLGHSQKRFQLLTKSSFCSSHHENNHSFKANSLLNLSCPRRYVGSRAVNLWVDSESIQFTIHRFSIRFKNDFGKFRTIQFDSIHNEIRFDSIITIRFCIF